MRIGCITYSYRSMAKTNYRGYLRADQVPLKKYFYALRPLLSVLWLERYATPAPIEFQTLLHLIDDRPALRADIDALLERKRAAPEMGLGDPVPSINAFIERQLARLEATTPDSTRQTGAVPALNALFHAILDESGR